MYRFLRCFLCLLVVCCLILNLSPIKADATAATVAIAGASTVAVPAAIVVGAALIALGIMAGTNDDFQRVVGNAVDSLGDWVKDGTVELIQTVDELGKKAYYVAGDMLEDLRTYSLSAEVIIPKELVFDNVYYPSAEDLALAAAAPYSVLVYSGPSDSDFVTWCIVYSYESPLIVTSPLYTSTGKGFSISTKNSGAKWFYRSTYSPWSTGTNIACSDGNYIVKSSQDFGAYAAKYTTSYDLTLGQVSSVPVDGTSAREWSEEYTNRGLYVDPVSGGDVNDEDAKWYWPVVLGPEVESLTQTDQWTGESPEEFDDYEIKEEYEIVGAPAVDFGYGIEIKPVSVPGTGDNTDVDSGVIDGSVDYTSLLDKIVGYVQSLWNAILELPGKFADWFDSILDAIETLPNKFATWFDSIVAGIEAIPGAFADWFADIISGLTSIWEAICSIPAAITDALTAIFVPSEDFLTEKVQDLRNRFNWIEPILGYGNYIKAQLISPEPPVLYVHLGDAEGSYNYGGTVKFLDLTWYERYKPLGDTIISGFLWALFAWRMYVKLPGIINGVAGDVGQITYGESAWQKAEGRKERKEKGGKNK